MKNTVGNIIFALLFLSFLAIPLVFLDTKSTVAVQENRMLASLPSLFQGGRFNGVFFKGLDEYFNDRFFFRRNLVDLNNNLNFKVLGKLGNIQVIIGRDRWLFFIDPRDGANLDDFEKKNLFSGAELEKVTAALINRKRWCESQGIRFIVLIPPNKHSVYPENFPLERPAGYTRMDQFMAALPPELIKTVIFPRDAIIAEKELHPYPLYIPTDTHWNKAGALVAYEALRDRVFEFLPDYTPPPLTFSIEGVKKDGIGDLVLFLGMNHWYTFTDPELSVPGGWESLYGYQKHENDHSGKEYILTEHVDPNLPRALIYRDSFFSSLEPLVSCLFSKAEYTWKNLEDTDKEHILEEKPDLVIWEIVERHFSDILTTEWH
jgi:hypothetical protein